MPVRMIHTSTLNTSVSELYDERPVQHSVVDTIINSLDLLSYELLSVFLIPPSIYLIPLIVPINTTPLSDHYCEPTSTNKYGISNITLEFGAKDNKIAIKVIKRSNTLNQVSRALQDATIEQTDDPSCILLHFKHVISGIKGFSITVRESKDNQSSPIEPLSFQFEKNIATLKSQNEDCREDQEITVSIPSIFTYNSDHPSKSVLGLMEHYLSKSITKEDPSIANPNLTHIPVPSEWLHRSGQESRVSSSYSPNYFSAGCQPIIFSHSSEATTVPSQSIGDFVGWLLEFPSKTVSTEPIISYRSVSVSVITAP